MRIQTKFFFLGKIRRYTQTRARHSSNVQEEDIKEDRIDQMHQCIDRLVDQVFGQRVAPVVDEVTAGFRYMTA